MKKDKVYIFFLIFTVMSCTNANSNQSKASEIDSLNGESETSVRAGLKQNMDKDTRQRLYFDDTVGVSQAPVKIISAKPVTQDYSNYKDIRITYKNVSNKTITGIKFRWYGLNAFNDPANMGNSADILGHGIGSGFTDDKLRPGKTTSGRWNILSQDLKKVVTAWPFEIAFNDGTKWLLKK